ncbi:MAG: KamA family radical SAM protein [Opitutaceae bacterium]|nr:KamA family radical SAM protein [Opitutaceae bacterium]
MQHIVTTRSKLEEFLVLTAAERSAIDQLQTSYPLKISEHYLRLVHPTDPNDPLRRAVIPALAELDHRVGEEDDDVHADEARYQPCPGIIHRYPGKLLLLPTLKCPSHCRFCFRKGRRVTQLSREDGERALAYIRSNPTIRDVGITGGDPLSLTDAELDHWLTELRAIRHVQILRITTKYPIYLPDRLTDAFVQMLTKHRPVYVIFSFLHPREITPELRLGLRKLADAGIMMLQQGPLLKGINDDTEVLKELFEQLVALQVIPYYASWGLTVPGAEHFVVDGKAAYEIIGALENQTSGFCIPHVITLRKGDKVRTLGWR